MCSKCLCYEYSISQGSAAAHLRRRAIFTVTYFNSVATNLENLEYSGITLNMENSGNSVQPQGKIVTKYFNCSFEYLVRVQY